MVALVALAPMAEPLPLPAWDGGGNAANRPMPIRPVVVRQPIASAEAEARAARFFALSQIPVIRRLS